MGWAIGTGSGGRDIGYGVPALCDQPGCNEEIDRGVSYACGSFRSDNGCGQYFCGSHLFMGTDEYDDTADFCDHCLWGLMHPEADWNDPAGPPYHEPKPDLLKWMLWKKYDQSWERWRNENPRELLAIDQRIAEADPKEIATLMAELELQMEQNQ